MSETSPITEQANPETELARDEFKQLLALHSKPVEPDRLFECLPESLRPSSESTENHSSGKNHHHEHQNGTLETGGFKHLTLIPPRTLPLLHDLALQMVQAGNQQQLLRIYRDTRSSVMDASLRKLGVEKLSKEDVQKMQWEVLEAKIGKWVLNIRIAVEVLFVGERRVCDQIFEGFDTLRDQCFAECIASSVSMLLSFGDAIARSKRSPEKLFVLLDMYKIMRELLSEIEVVFGGKACNEIRESTFGLTKRLAQTAQETFGDFEEAVEKDATKTAVLDGTVHPLTSYIINCVKFLFDYQSTLEQLFQEFESSGETSSQLATITMRIMQALQTNLDGRSKQFRDPALMHLFLMNNIHYMVRYVRRSEAKDLLGDDWVQRYRRVVQQHANQYRRNAWSKILQCLSTQGLTSSSVGGGSAVSGEGGSGASRGLIRDRFKTFNIQFEELHQKQSQWIVHDSELREALILAVAQVLLPAYRSFIKRFGPLVESGKNPQKYIRYTAEDLERMLGEFFEGKTSNEPTFRNPNNVRRRRKRIVVDALKSLWTGAVSASAREHNNVDMAQQREPLLTGEFERGNDLIGGGIEIPRDTPDDQDELKKLEGSKSRDMVDDFESGWTGAVSASAREQNNVEMAQQQEPLLTGECEQAIDLTGGGIELPDDQDELKKLEGSKSRDMVDFLKSGWTLLLTSLIIEIASAVFDQLGYALVGMVLAFVALLVATADLIHLARKERMSLLPIFHRPSTRTLAPGKPVGTIVEYFGLVGAVWQCFYSTVEYAYACQKRDNPIKMSLLPFIFLSCVVISKLIKTEFIDESA